MNLTLSIALARNHQTQPILDGLVQPAGIDLMCTPADGNEMFWRQLRFRHFDVSEMSMSSLMINIANGNRDWIGLPVFTTRNLFHSWMLVRRSSGIVTPADLKGRRVGVPEYQQTSAVWTRGVLEHEFGIKPADMEFYMERLPAHSHGHATGSSMRFGGRDIHQIPAETNIGELLIEGELDATLLYIRNDGGDLIDRSTADFSHHPDIGPLFRMETEGPRYFAKTGLLHINHTVVVRRELAERHPWVILNLYKAFQEANRLVERRRLEALEYHFLTGMAPPDVRTPLVRHGVVANREVLETLAQYSFEQGLTPRPIGLDEIFDASLMEQ